MRYGFWIIASAVVVLDQWTKHVVQVRLPLYGEPLAVIPGVVFLTHVHNTGVAFSMLSGAGRLLIAAAAAAVVVIVAYRARLLRSGQPLSPLLAVGLALPLGGAVGNMIDRIRFGRVVDFIDLRWWPVFNVADSAITLGAVALLLFFLLIGAGEAPGETRPATRECGSESGG